GVINISLPGGVAWLSLRRRDTIDSDSTERRRPMVTALMTNKKPNIILLVLDTHRVERMSMYGYAKDTTPELGRFAEEATVFDWAISPAGWTVPSHASMFTGLYPSVHQ